MTASSSANLGRLIFGAGVVALILAIGFVFRLPWVLGFWPWADGRLTLIFVGSIMAAIAAAMLWMGMERDWGALAAGGLNLTVTSGGIAVHLFGLAGQGRPELMPYALSCAAFALGNLALFFWARRLALVDERPMPAPVRWSFVAFGVVLIVVGAALLLNVPNVMPWTLKPESGPMIGWIFFGDAFYFFYALLHRRWVFAKGQLWSFLAYDIALFPALAATLPTVKPEFALNLYVYLAVLIYSAVLAVYYLFINPQTKGRAANASSAAA